MVNHRRFLSSVALPIAPQFMFEASCSAADAMEPHAGEKDLGRLGNRLGRQLNLAAGLLDRGNRRRRGASDLHFYLGLDLAFAKEADAVRRALEQAGREHRGAVDRLGGVELLVVDRLLQRAEVDHLPSLLVRRTETTLGDTTIKRHLAALEALDGHATARLLALHATAGSLALAGADAAAHAHATLAGAFVVSDLVQLHRSSLCT